MPLSTFAAVTLDHEARALLTRLAIVKPFAQIIPAVAAAHISPAATTAIEEYLVSGRKELRKLVTEYLQWIRRDGRRVGPAEAQRRLAIIRLKFNAVLTQFDIFADALVQRCEHEYGVWLAGLDTVADDALSLPGGYFTHPPIVVYLDRGHGAAIRRARTRLPGGGENPVAIIRIPRERMVGSGIASSLMHEVGHQGAALLGLIASMQSAIRDEQKKSSDRHRIAWYLWHRWISEILADFWAIAKVGVAATQGLIGVVSLPRAFVFRVNIDDPHPVPWIRVKLSIAMGKVLYPHPQWEKLSQVWEAFYPKAGLGHKKLHIIQILEETMPRFTRLLVNHRPVSLAGKSLGEVFSLEERMPNRLSDLYERWRVSPGEMQNTSPALVFAVLGQAKQDRKLKPAEESRIIAKKLNQWALGRAMRPLSFQNKRRPRRPPVRIMTDAT